MRGDDRREHLGRPNSLSRAPQRFLAKKRKEREGERESEAQMGETIRTRPTPGLGGVCQLYALLPCHAQHRRWNINAFSSSQELAADLTATG
jgi:hypothetical protein